MATHSNLFVRNLPTEFDQAAVEDLFKPFGNVASCKYYRTAAVPYAFVKYETIPEAQAAVRNLNNTQLYGKQILVKLADSDAPGESPNSNLYVKGIPTSWNEASVTSFFASYGNVTSVKLLSPIQGADSVGGLVRMSSVEEAREAKMALTGVIPPGETSPLSIKYADTPDDKARKAVRLLTKLQPQSFNTYQSHRDEPEPYYYPQDRIHEPYGYYPEGPPSYDQEAANNNLYVRGVPASWDEESVRSFFAAYGTIVNMKLLSPLEGATTQSALIRMTNVEEAKGAKNGLHGVTPPGATAPLSVRYADTPQDKMRKKGFGMNRAPDYYPTYEREQGRAGFPRSSYMPEAPQYGFTGMGGDVETPNTNLYLKGVPARWTEDYLRTFFSRFGNVVSVKVLTPLAGATTQGALVRMTLLEEAMNAKAALHNTYPPGESAPLIVKYADTHEDKARRSTKPFAHSGAPQRFTPYPTRNTSAPQRFSIVPSAPPPQAGFASPPYAQGGYQEPYPQSYPPQPMAPPLSGYAMPAADMSAASHPLAAAFAPAPQAAQAVAVPQLSGPTTICITNLPSSADELLVIKRFSPYGAIISSSLVPSGPSCIAFVTYSDAKAAWAAVEGMSGQIVGQNKVNVSIQIGVIT